MTRSAIPFALASILVMGAVITADATGYAISSMGSSTCPTGSGYITNRSDCEAAAESLGFFTSSSSTLSSSSYQGGCLKTSTIGSSIGQKLLVLYNEYNTGHGSAEPTHAVICKIGAARRPPPPPLPEPGEVMSEGSDTCPTGMTYTDCADCEATALSLGLTWRGAHSSKNFPGRSRGCIQLFMKYDEEYGGAEYNEMYCNTADVSVSSCIYTPCQLSDESPSVMTTAIVCKSEPPSPGPTTNPSPGPTTNPSPGPTTNPSPGPTTNPSPGPTTNPSPGPTTNPSPGPTTNPSPGPTTNPSPGPTTNPSPGPTTNPSPGPTTNPSPGPTTNPSPGPTTNPSPGPSTNPSPGPSTNPTSSAPSPTDECDSKLFQQYNETGFKVASKNEAFTFITKIKTAFKAIKKSYRAAKTNLRKLGREAKE